MMIIGMDIGGTKIEGALFDDKFNKLKSIKIPTQTHKRRDEIIRNIVSVAKELLGGKKMPVGIGMFGFKGNYGMPHAPQLIGLNMEKILHKKLGVPVVIENDAHCFAIAESAFGAAKGYHSMVGVTIGTGIGGGAIVDGHVLRGRNSAAVHIAHMIIDPSGQRCMCGQKGDFESWCSGNNITRRYISAGGKIKNPDPRKIFYSKERIAKQIIDETFEKMAIGFANVIKLYNPEIIVVGGGVSNLPIYARLNRLVRKYDSLGLGRGVKIVKNKLGDTAAVYGAALIALKPGSF
jgi:predicted NBD/HSP70 family sugar kinase